TSMHARALAVSVLCTLAFVSRASLAQESSPEPPPPPFAWGDFTWMNGQSRQKDFPLKPFGDAVTLSLYLDVNYAYSLNHPRDDTFTGTASVPRHNDLDL